MRHIKRLALLAAICGLSATSTSAWAKRLVEPWEVTDPQGRELFFILEIRDKLGQGQVGEVHEALILLPNGEEHVIALKQYAEAHTADPEVRHMLTDSHRRHGNLFTRVDWRHIHAEAGNLLLHRPGEKPQMITVSEIVDGSIDEIADRFRIRADNSQPLAQIRNLHALTTQGSHGIFEMAEIGVVHGEIKPANVFYQMEGGELHLMLADLDQISRTGKDLRVKNIAITPPEDLAGAAKSAVARDVYALANTVYRMTYGQYPLNAYLKREVSRLREDPEYRQDLDRIVFNYVMEPGHEELKKEYLDHIRRGGRSHTVIGLMAETHEEVRKLLTHSEAVQAVIFKNEKRYARFLEWVDRDLAETRGRMSLGGTAQAQFNDIHRFIHDGLAYSPETRVAAMKQAAQPLVDPALRRRSCPQRMRAMFKADFWRWVEPKK